MRDDDPIRSLEGELHRTRQDLTSALQELKDSFTLKRMLPEKVSGLVSGEDSAGAKIASAVSSATESAKQNPGAMTALGLAAATAVLGKLGASKAQAGPAPVSGDMRLNDLFVKAKDKAPSDDELWMADADDLRSKAADLLEVIDEAMEREIAPKAELLTRRQEVLEALQRDVRRVMSRGLDKLDEGARAKVFAQRQKLYAGHVGKEDHGWGRTLMIGGAVAGAGLALAYILPRTAGDSDLLHGLRQKIEDEAEKLSGSDHMVTSLLASAVHALVKSESPARDPDDLSV